MCRLEGASLTALLWVWGLVYCDTSAPKLHGSLECSFLGLLPVALVQGYSVTSSWPRVNIVLFRSRKWLLFIDFMYISDYSHRWNSQNLIREFEHLTYDKAEVSWRDDRSWGLGQVWASPDSCLRFQNSSRCASLTSERGHVLKTWGTRRTHYLRTAIHWQIQEKWINPKGGNWHWKWKVYHKSLCISLVFVL